MPANNLAIFSKQGEVANNGATGFAGTLLTATGDYTGVSANHQLVWTADATNGGFIARIRFKALGTNVASVARIYLNNGSVNTTAANNAFYGEISLPATTASNTQATTDFDYLMGFALPPGFRIYAGLATTVAAGWVPIGIGGRY